MPTPRQLLAAVLGTRPEPEPAALASSPPEAPGAEVGYVIGPDGLTPDGEQVVTLHGDSTIYGGGAIGGGVDGYRTPTMAGESGAIYADPIQTLVRRLPGRVASHSARLLSWELIRWAIPALHAAIVKRRFLEGSVEIVSDDPGLARALSQFWESVPVGDTFGTGGAVGGDAYLDALSECSDEYGVGFGEIVVTEVGVERLALPSPRTFEYVREEGEDPAAEGGRRQGQRLYQMQDGGRQPIESPFVQTLTFTPNPASAWGRPLAWGLEPTAEILLRMYASANDLWYRSGSPSEFFTIDPSESELSDAPSSADMKAALTELATLLGTVNRSRAAGRPANLFYAYGKGKLRREALGANVLTNSLAPQFRAHLTAMGGQVIQNADVPSFLFPAGIIAGDGLNSDRAKVEAVLATAAAMLRNIKREAVARTVLDTQLGLDGAARFIGRYTVRHKLPPLTDPAAVEEARERRAKATQTELLNVAGLLDLELLDSDEEVLAYLIRAGVLTAEGR